MPTSLKRSVSKEVVANLSDPNTSNPSPADPRMTAVLEHVRRMEQDNREENRLLRGQIDRLENRSPTVEPGLEAALRKEISDLR